MFAQGTESDCALHRLWQEQRPIAEVLEHEGSWAGKHPAATPNTFFCGLWKMLPSRVKLFVGSDARHTGANHSMHALVNKPGARQLVWWIAFDSRITHLLADEQA